MEQDSKQPPQQSSSMEGNPTMQCAPHHHQYSPSYPSPFPQQAYQNSQAQALAYYQSYHYATTNHPQASPTPQITYPLTVPQVTYQMPTTPILKSRPKATHLHHKSKNPHHNPKHSPPTTQSSQLPEAPTLILILRGNGETTIDKSII
jgi:hypothetical protein